MPYIVPAPSPAPPTGFGQFVGGLGQGIQNFEDLLLKAILAGQYGPVPQYTVQDTRAGAVQPGTLRLESAFPQGHGAFLRPPMPQGAFTSPQITQGYQRQLNQGAILPSGLPTGLTAIPTGQTRIRFQPPLTRQAQQLQIEESRAKLANLPLEQEKLRSEIAINKRAAEGGFSLVTIDVAGNLVPPGTLGSRQLLVQTTKSGEKVTPITETAEQQVQLKQRAEARNLLEDTKLIMADIDHLFSFLDDVPAGRWAGSVAQIEKMFGTDSPAALGARDYESEQQAFIAKLQKTLGGEVGVLTDRDIDRIVKMMPRFYYTAEERERRIASVKSYINRRVVSFTQRAGLDAKVSVENENVVREGQIAVNPKTGQRIRWQGGQWQPVP